MKLSVIIVNYNVKYFLEVCLHAVQSAAKGIDAEIIVVDNNSKDDSCTMIKAKYPQVRLIENNENTGFSRANNQGVAIAKGEYILFVNPDTVMPEDFLTKTIAYMDEHPQAGAIGPRLIDGKGAYAPDGKKSFPSLSVAIFKTTGINKLFSKSTYFNKYYAVHVAEDETAEVDILSGCCMMVRHDIIKQIGGAFDEAYFMYCEDFDLCYRIQQAGYKNIYYPQATLIHYKGESTRKATISHVRIFNDALSVFVKKHYSKTNASLFILLINIGIVLRAVLSVIKQIFKVLRMPMFDAIVLLVTLTLIKDFWVNEVKNILPIPLSSIIKTFPVYILLWVLSMYFNGTYDKGYRAVRVVRGMAIGTVAILAYYGLLPAELRFSRAIIVFSAFVGTVSMLVLHGVFYKLGIFKFIPYDLLPGKGVIVATETAYQRTLQTLKNVNYAPDITGRVATELNEQTNAIAHMGELKQYAYAAGINEIIFCVNGLTYADIFTQMQHCGSSYEYKIHLPGSTSFVGSNSSHTAGDLYTLDRLYNIADSAKQRNKRIVDILFALLFIPLLPILILVVKQPAQLFINCLQVIAGRKTWVGYTAKHSTLPPIRQGILPPYNIANNYQPTQNMKEEFDINYAQNYQPSIDIDLIRKNYKYLGGFL